MSDSGIRSKKFLNRFIPEQIWLGSLMFERDQLFASWIAIEIIIALGVCLALGSNGLAQFFCDHVEVQMCYEKGFLE